MHVDVRCRSRSISRCGGSSCLRSCRSASNRSTKRAEPIFRPAPISGAPVAPMLVRKALWTTFVSALLFAALDALYVLGGLTLNSFRIVRHWRCADHGAAGDFGSSMPSFKTTRRVRHSAGRDVRPRRRRRALSGIRAALPGPARAPPDQRRERRRSAALRHGGRLSRDPRKIHQPRDARSRPAQSAGRICRRAVQLSRKHLELSRRAGPPGSQIEFFISYEFRSRILAGADGLDVRFRVPQIRAGFRDKGRRRFMGASRASRALAGAVRAGPAPSRPKPVLSRPCSSAP